MSVPFALVWCGASSFAVFGLAFSPVLFWSPADWLGLSLCTSVVAVGSFVWGPGRAYFFG